MTAFRYKWKTETCTFSYKFMCQMYHPNCPMTYKYDPDISTIPGIPGYSCYKVTSAGAYLDFSADKKRVSVSILDDICRNEGTRLAVVENDNLLVNLVEWIEDEPVDQSQVRQLV
jgi:hypothetical protein